MTRIDQPGDLDIGIAGIRAHLAERAAASAGQIITLAERRVLIEQATSVNPLAEGTRVEAVTLGGVAGERLTPAEAREGWTILYLHGGGFVSGSAATHRAIGSRLARASGACVHMIDYRLAPEHPYPAGLDDCEVAWDALVAQGCAPEKSIIAGDSAGGNLALALALRLKARGAAQPGGIVAISPWTDLAMTSDSYETRAHTDPILAKAALEGMLLGYLDGTDPRDPIASPLYGDYAGVAPILVQVGSDEILLGDALKLAEVAGSAHVAVDVQVWPEMLHVWHSFADRLPASRRAIVAAGDWIIARLG